MVLRMAGAHPPPLPHGCPAQHPPPLSHGWPRRSAQTGHCGRCAQTPAALVRGGQGAGDGVGMGWRGRGVGWARGMVRWGEVGWGDRVGWVGAAMHQECPHPKEVLGQAAAAPQPHTRTRDPWGSETLTALPLAAQQGRRPVGGRAGRRGGRAAQAPCLQAGEPRPRAAAGGMVPQWYYQGTGNVLHKVLPPAPGRQRKGAN